MTYDWLIFALLSAIAAAFVAIFGKIGLQNVDANTATMIRAGIMFAFLVIVILVTGKASEISATLSNSRAVYYIALSGIAGALSWLFYFMALKMGNVSQVVPIDRMSVVFALILALLILGEKISIKTAIGAALMAVGAILVALG